MQLFLALPIYGHVHAPFALSLLNLTARRPCDMVIRPCIGDSLVARARNRLAAEFLASDCTHILWLDSDLIFSPEHIAELVRHGERHPLVCGLYPKKQKDLGWVINLLDQPQKPDEQGLHKIKYAGTGCLLIAREVFERMRAAHPEIEYDPDEGDTPSVKWDFFSCGVVKFPDGRRRYLSEDWYFCQRALDLGYDILCATGVVMKHCGEAIYPLQDIEGEARALAAIETIAH